VGVGTEGTILHVIGVTAAVVSGLLAAGRDGQCGGIVVVLVGVGNDERVRGRRGRVVQRGQSEGI